MCFVGIDVAVERHVVAVVDETDQVLIKATPFTEDADGYNKLFGVLGAPTDALVAMEATGHYWKNLFAALVAAGFAVALLNPRFRDRLRQDFGDRGRQLHRLVDLGLPAFTRYVRDLGSELASAISIGCSSITRSASC